MIGVNTSIFKSAGRKLVNLLGTLKNRATYYENGTDSTAEKNRIESLGILDDATILLTPTAYSDARVHSVKTYTGNELVTNGDFSDGRNDWTNNASATLSTENDKLKVSISGAGSGYGQQNITGLTIGATYKISAEGEIGTSTRLALYTPNAGFNNLYADGAISTFFTATSTTENLRLYVYDDGAYGFWDNVSVIDVSSDFDFDRASSATRINSDGLVQDMQSITDPELVLNGDFEELGDELVTNGDFSGGSTGWTVVDSDTNNYVEFTEGFARLKFLNTSPITKLETSTQILQANQTYELVVDVHDVTSGGIKIDGVGIQEYFNTEGVTTRYITPTGNTPLRFYRNTANVDITLASVSVKQVDPNDRWTVGATWSLGDGVANYEGGSNSAIIQNITLTSGNTYNIKFTVSNASGNASIWIGNGSGGVNYFGGTYAPYANGSYDLYFTMPSNQTTLAFYGASSGPNFSIDNISVKDITFSTDVDLARINYDSNGDNGHILLEPTSTNLLPYSEDFTQWSALNGGTGSLPVVTSNTTISPSGEQNADTISFDKGSASGGGDYSLLRLDYGGADVDGTASIYLKADTNVDIEISSDDGSYQTVSVTNTWQRFSVSDATSDRLSMGLRGAVPSNNTATVYAWGGQLEALPYATSYIPTLTGSTVTRAGEKLYGSGNSTLINSEEGVLYAEIAALVDDTTYRFISLSDGTTGNSVVLGYHNVSNTVRGYVYSGTTIVATMSYAVDSIRDFVKLAIKYKRDDFALWVDGVKRGVDGAGAVPIGLDSLQFDSGDGGSFLYGKCKALAVFDRALTDQELTDLTT